VVNTVLEEFLHTAYNLQLRRAAFPQFYGQNTFVRVVFRLAALKKTVPDAALEIPLQCFYKSFGAVCGKAFRRISRENANLVQLISIFIFVLKTKKVPVIHKL
jgi:hypothetical protein